MRILSSVMVLLVVVLLCQFATAEEPLHCAGEIALIEDIGDELGAKIITAGYAKNAAGLQGALFEADYADHHDENLDFEQGIDDLDALIVDVGSAISSAGSFLTSGRICWDDAVLEFGSSTPDYVSVEAFLSDASCYFDECDDDISEPESGLTDLVDQMIDQVFYCQIALHGCLDCMNLYCECEEEED